MGTVLVEGKSLHYEKNPMLQGEYLKRAIESPESNSMCAGLYRFDPGTSFEVTFEEGDEVVYIMEGQAKMTSEGKTFVANAGDFVYWSKGTTISYSTENGCAGVYVGYPATFIEHSIKNNQQVW